MQFEHEEYCSEIRLIVCPEMYEKYGITLVVEIVPSIVLSRITSNVVKYSLFF